MSNEITTALSCREILPLEVWKIILKNHIYPNVENYKTLLEYRLVCKDIKNLIDQVLKEDEEATAASLWQPSFLPTWADYLKTFSGTRFSTANSVNAFVFPIAMAGFTGNPFPNGTVIISPKEGASASDIGNLYKAVLSLILTFGEHISYFVFSFPPHFTHIEIILLVVNSFKLSNLKILLLHKAKWDPVSSDGKKLMELMRSMETDNCLPIPPNLKQLQIFGEDSFQPFFNVFLYFKKLLQNLTHLRVDCCSKADVDRNPIHRVGNLQQLKLQKIKLNHPTNRFFKRVCPQFPQIPATLKELSIKIGKDGSPPGQKLAEYCEKLDLRADSLEYLHLDGSEHQLWVPPPPAEANNQQLNLEVSYQKLQHVVIKLPFSPNTFSCPVFRSLLQKKCPNLKKITWHLTQQPPVGNDNPPKTFFSYISTVWETIFPQVQFVNIPYFGWKLVQGQLFTFDFRQE